MLKIIVTTLFSFIMCVNCYAQPIQVTIDPNQLPKEIVEQIQKQNTQYSQIKEIITDDSFVKIAETITNTIKTIAKDLNIEINNFATSPVGLMICGLIIWSYFGKEFFNVLFSCIIYFGLFIPILTFMYYQISLRTCCPKINKIKVEEIDPDNNSIKKTYTKYEYAYLFDVEKYDSNELTLWKVVLLVSFLGISIISAVNIF